MRPFDSGLLEVRDAIDRRVTYVCVFDEDTETLGLIAWLDGGRMTCLCQEGRLIASDRLDGSKTWQDEGCAHESHFLRIKRERETPPIGISGGYSGVPSSAMWD